MSSISDLRTSGQLTLLHINFIHCSTTNKKVQKLHIINFNRYPLLQDAHCKKKGNLTRFPENWSIFPSTNNNAHVVVRNIEHAYSHLYIGSNCSFKSIMAKEGTILIGTSYAAPLFWLRGVPGRIATPYHKEEGFHLWWGHTSKPTPHFEDVGMKTSGWFLTEQLIVNNLEIANIHYTDTG